MLGDQAVYKLGNDGLWALSAQSTEYSVLPKASPGCSIICLDCICLSNCQIPGHSDAYIRLEAVLVFTRLKKILGIER